MNQWLLIASRDQAPLQHRRRLVHPASTRVVSPRFSAAASQGPHRDARAGRSGKGREPLGGQGEGKLARHGGPQSVALSRSFRVAVPFCFVVVVSCVVGAGLLSLVPEGPPFC